MRESEKIDCKRANELLNRSYVQFVTHSDIMEFVTHSSVCDKCLECMRSTQRRIITMEYVEFVTRYSYIWRVPEMYQEFTMQRIMTMEYVHFVTRHI